MSHYVELNLPTDSLWTLDPSLVAHRLCTEVRQTTVCLEDLAWRDYDSFKERRVVSGALRVAENDARRRGPAWEFRILHDDLLISGHVERRRCEIHRRDAHLPTALRDEFLEFLQRLEIPGAMIESYWLEGNTRTPA